MPLDPTVQPSPAPHLSPVPSFDNAHILYSSPFLHSTPPTYTPGAVTPGDETPNTLELHIPVQIPLPPTPMPVPVIESYSIDAFTMETPSSGMTLTPASSVTAISPSPRPYPCPSFSSVREYTPQVVSGTERSASVKPEQMHVKKGKADEKKSPEPGYDILELTPEEREAYEKEKSQHLLRAMNVPLNYRRLKAMRAAGKLPTPLFNLRSRSKSKSRGFDADKENVAVMDMAKDYSPLGILKPSRSVSEEDEKTLSEMQRLEMATIHGETWYLPSASSRSTEWERHGSRQDSESMAEPIVPGHDLCTPILPDDGLLDDYPSPSTSMPDVHVIARSPDRSPRSRSETLHSQYPRHIVHSRPVIHLQPIVYSHVIHSQAGSHTMATPSELAHSALFPSEARSHTPDTRAHTPNSRSHTPEARMYIPDDRSHSPDRSPRSRAETMHSQPDILDSHPISRSAPSPAVQPRRPFYPYADPSEPILGRKTSARRAGSQIAEPRPTNRSRSPSVSQHPLDSQAQPTPVADPRPLGLSRSPSAAQQLYLQDSRMQPTPNSVTRPLTHTTSQRVAQPRVHDGFTPTPRSSTHTLSPPQHSLRSRSASPASSFRLPIPPPSSPRPTAGSRTPGRPADRPLDYMYAHISRPVPSCKSCGSSSASSVSSSEANSPAQSYRSAPRPSIASSVYRQIAQAATAGANALGMSFEQQQMTPRSDAHVSLAVNYDYGIQAVPPASPPKPIAMPTSTPRMGLAQSPYGGVGSFHGTPMHRSL